MYKIMYIFPIPQIQKTIDSSYNLSKNAVSPLVFLELIIAGSRGRHGWEERHVPLSFP